MSNTEKPNMCPKCGGKVVEVVYGFVNANILDAVERGDVVLGGCCVCLDSCGRPLSPRWSCTKCGKGFGKMEW